MNGHLIGLLSRGSTLTCLLPWHCYTDTSWGQGTVLDTMIKNFRNGFSEDYGVKLTPSRLKTVNLNGPPLVWGVLWKGPQMSQQSARSGGSSLEIQVILTSSHILIPD